MSKGVPAGSPSAMKIHTSIAAFQGVERPVLTTGTFDGVHLGHQVILKRLRDVARREGGESVLFTFHPHPRMVLYPQDNDLRLLNTPGEKQQLLEQAGLDHLLVVPFSRDFSRIHALDYVRDILVDRLHIHAMVIGYDHRFGRNREGDIGLLRRTSDVYGFTVEEIPAQEIDHVKVSSTKIREALLVGQVAKANALLGYPYMLSGVVVKGDQLGRTIGWPTANIGAIDHYKLIPGDGIYAITATIRRGRFKGMMSIGVRPTVKEGGERTVEAHLFGLDADIYGEPITVYLHRRLRDELRFESMEVMKHRIARDKVEALEALMDAEP
ncbi:MAG: bifunctional riboflavin kinase/FAD synthetase [Flavobacteriia bacterium]|nr:bifunctional riboflavin kinase/FAD synthetase [Flavobacteriia bacterium]